MENKANLKSTINMWDEEKNLIKSNNKTLRQ